MDGNVLSISNEEAERIKKAVAEEYKRLRESLRSTEEKEDKSHFRRNCPKEVQIGEAERIKSAASDMLEKLRKSISSSEGKGEISKFAVGAKIVTETNVGKQSQVHKDVLVSGKEEENGISAPKKNNLCRGFRSSTKVSGSREVEADYGVDSAVNKPFKNSSITNPGVTKESYSRSSNEELVQHKRDISPIVVDYTNPLPSTSSITEISSPRLMDNVQKPSANNLKNLNSDSVECISKTEPSLANDRDCGGQRDEDSVSQAKESHSWENFVAHLVAIKGNNNLWDLLIRDDITIFNNFTALCIQAQTAFIHLLNSDYTCYRESGLLNSKMNHELKPVIDTLIEKQLLNADAGNENIELLVELLSVQELKDICRMSGLRDDGRKAVLKKSLIDFSKNQNLLDKVVGQDYNSLIREAILKVLGRVIKLNHAPRELFLRTQLLYALPLTKNMKVDGRVPLISIMNEVSDGKINYPDYSVEPLRKLFPSREALVRFQRALHLEANIKWRLKLKEYDEAVNLHESAYIQFQEELRDEHASQWSARLPNCLRTFTRGSALARAVHLSMECLRVKKMYTKMIAAYETLLYQDLYLNLHRGIWYDQLAQIYHNTMKDVSKTINFLTEALADPSLNYIDRVLLSERASPIVNGKKRKKSHKYEEIKPMLCNLKDIPEISIKARCFDAKIEKEKKFSYVYETIEGVGQMLSTPEEVIMLHFKQSGYNHGVHSPFVIGTSIFGILLWDVIYHTKVPNVFLCPYQIIPLDLTSGEFYVNRESQIKTRIAQIKELWSEKDMYDHVHKTWLKEKGKKSVVSWKTFQDLHQFEIILRCIGRKILAKICDKMAKDFHLLRKGFPSMILWNQTTKTAKFIQVIEPNSPLTPSQKTWLLHITTAGGDAFACYVNAVGSRPPKRKHDPADDSIDLDESMELDCAY